MMSNWRKAISQDLGEVGERFGFIGTPPASFATFRLRLASRLLRRKQPGGARRQRVEFDGIEWGSCRRAVSVRRAPRAAAVRLPSGSFHRRGRRRGGTWY